MSSPAKYFAAFNCSPTQSCQDWSLFFFNHAMLLFPQAAAQGTSGERAGSESGSPGSSVKGSKAKKRKSKQLQQQQGQQGEGVVEDADVGKGRFVQASSKQQKQQTQQAPALEAKQQQQQQKAQQTQQQQQQQQEYLYEPTFGLPVVRRRLSYGELLRDIRLEKVAEVSADVCERMRAHVRQQRRQRRMPTCGRSHASPCTAGCGPLGSSYREGGKGGQQGQHSLF